MTPQRGINADYEETYTEGDGDNNEPSSSVISMAKQTLADALTVQNAGAVAVVVESVPSQVAASITKRLKIPTIGIG